MIQEIEANLVDIVKKEIYPAMVSVEAGKIISVIKNNNKYNTFILPGFIDAHIHIESTMLVPSEFARLAVLHGTVATLSDPHEIANVLGISGVEFMINNAKKSGFKCYFGASPCVPATPFETSGSSLDAKKIEALLQRDDILYLSEVMNFPGVINGDEDMLSKIAIAKKLNKPIDGHAPGIIGDDLQKYIDAGIATDHEAFTYAEAEEKLQRGMKILIREGSAAKNFDALVPLIDLYYENLMFCSDDKHPNDLLKGHINSLVTRALTLGHDLFKVLQIACINPINHYKLDVGQLRVGDFADFIEVKDLQTFEILKTVINGNIVAKNGNSLLKHIKTQHPNNFNVSSKIAEDFMMHEVCKSYDVIDALEHQLITKSEFVALEIKNGVVMPDIQKDILIISVVNRYENVKPAISFIHGFGLSEGAIASSVAHDSHNIIAVGTSHKSICEAVNIVIKNKGGISAVDDNGNSLELPLRVAGLMSDDDGFEVAKKYETMDAFVKEKLKSTFEAPFMTLSFMALLVIPDLKLSDKGLFDGKSFHFITGCKK